jgi:uncharacterized protein (DUF433 family)
METTEPGSPWFPFVWIDPDRLGGTPCFRGSRVPIRNLFDYLEEGHTVAEFLDDFPPVTGAQVQAVLHLAGQTLIGPFAA